jgi:hypothetical protein
MPQELSHAIVTAARQTLADALGKIEHCIGQLSEDQLWWRPRPEMNSIANLMLHLSGNVRQYIVAGVGGAKDLRNRPAEFADRSHRPKQDLLIKLKSTIDEADNVLARLSADQLVAQRQIQGWDLTLTEAVFGCISHFCGHTQEIIHMTRHQLGEAYQSKYVPQTEAQMSQHGPAT